MPRKIEPQSRSSRGTPVEQLSPEVCCQPLYVLIKHWGNGSYPSDAAEWFLVRIFAHDHGGAICEPAYL